MTLRGRFLSEVPAYRGQQVSWINRNCKRSLGGNLRLTLSLALRSRTFLALNRSH